MATDYTKLYRWSPRLKAHTAKRTVDGETRQFQNKDPKKLHEMVCAFERGELQRKEKNRPVPTLSKLVSAWSKTKQKEVKPNTWRTYDEAAGRICAAMGNKPIDKITPADISSFFSGLAQSGAAGSTVRTTKTAVKSIFDYYITNTRNPVITINPVISAKLPQKMKKVKRAAPGDDAMQAIIDNVDQPYGFLPYCLLYTGARRGELVALLWDDIDFEKNEVVISKEVVFEKGKAVLYHHAKTEAGLRTIPLLPDLKRQMLLRRPAKWKGCYVIAAPTDPRKPMPESTLKRRWIMYMRSIGFAEDKPTETFAKNGRHYIKHHWRATITPHQFRHGFITLCYEAGIDVKTTQAIVGHSDSRVTTDIYTDLRKRHQSEQVKKLADYMSATYGRSKW